MYEIALEILNILKNNKLEGYIVGGYSRDKYLNIESLDIDICTSANYQQLSELFDIKNKNYGSYDVFYKGYKFDVTTYRIEEEYENNRFPKEIKYTSSLKEDLKRRDFTINTLCIDYNGNYIDILNSKQDLDNKIIKCVGNSDYKISQDILRSLRAIRFATILNFKIDEELKNSIKKYNYLLKELSKKRKEEELNKILSNPNKEYGINLINELDLKEYL